MYVDTYMTRLSPYPRRFIFASSVEDFDEVVTELARRNNEKGKPNKWLDFKGKFRGAGICATGGNTCVLGVRFDPKNMFSPTHVTQLIGTISHEIQYMLLHTCTAIGYNPMREHEPYTYITKWVLERFMDFMRSYHGLVITASHGVNTSVIRDIHAHNIMPLLHGMEPANIRDALARESRALLGNQVRIVYTGGMQSTTYFEQ
jgi:hypothetical protein